VNIPCGNPIEFIKNHFNIFSFKVDGNLLVIYLQLCLALKSQSLRQLSIDFEIYLDSVSNSLRLIENILVFFFTINISIPNEEDLKDICHCVDNHQQQVSPNLL
jgi:hypothetical protein